MKSHLNLRQVEAFRAVMLTGRMTAAAELMLITQPAVSRLISDFERSTRLRLFERKGNQISPTPEAVTLMKEIDRAFVGLNKIALVAEDIRKQSAGTLRIAAMPALGNGMLARFLARFLRDKPHLNASLISLPSSMVIEEVAIGHADIGYAAGPLDRPGFIIETRSMAAVVAIPASHPLAQKEMIEPQDLNNQRMVVLDSSSIFAMRGELALAGISRLGAIETRLSHTALSLVDEGAGIAIIDPTSAIDFRGKNIVIRPFSIFIDDGFCVIRSANRISSVVADRFAEEFEAYHIEQVTEWRSRAPSHIGAMHQDVRP